MNGESTAPPAAVVHQELWHHTHGVMVFERLANGELLINGSPLTKSIDHETRGPAVGAAIGEPNIPGESTT